MCGHRSTVPRPRLAKSYCTICGTAILHCNAAILLAPCDVVPKWPRTAMLLHKEDEPFSGCQISELHARHIVGSNYRLKDVAKNVLAFSCVEPHQAGDRPLYIPCHTQCLYIAKRAISSKKADPLHHLWLLLLARIETAKRHMGQWPQCRWDIYQGWFNETARSARRLIDKDVEEKEMYEAEPLDIPDITLSICKHLEEVSVSDPATTDPKSCLPPLPQEIADLIWQHLCPLSNPPIACTRLVSPEQWQYALQDLRMLPWLWDIDTNVLDTKERTRSLDRCSDWESLIRRLATRDTYSSENDGVNTQIKVTRSIEGLAPGLRNRRRIWDLAIDMLDE